MVIKITKNSDRGNKIEYKSAKFILTPQDIKEADTFDIELIQTIKNIENYLLRKGALSRDKKKLDPLLVWYIVGKKINEFINEHKIEKEEKQIFWNQFYNRRTLIHKRILSKKSVSTKNDFQIASLLAKFKFKVIKKVGPWAMWREILTYKLFLSDKRILNWVINELIKNPRTRDNARPFLKTVANRFKRMETTMLTDNELFKKIKELSLLIKKSNQSQKRLSVTKNP